jgi:hypothetical protein
MLWILGVVLSADHLNIIQGLVVGTAIASKDTSVSIKSTLQSGDKSPLHLCKLASGSHQEAAIHECQSLEYLLVAVAG